MSSTTQTPLTMEQKILLATQQSESVISIFSPSIAGLVQAGVEVEPIVSGFLQMIVSLFKHHTSTAAPAPATTVTVTAPAPAMAPVAPAPAPVTTVTAPTVTAPVDNPPKPVIEP